MKSGPMFAKCEAIFSITSLASVSDYTRGLKTPSWGLGNFTNFPVAQPMVFADTDYRLCIRVALVFHNLRLCVCGIVGVTYFCHSKT